MGQLADKLTNSDTALVNGSTGQPSFVGSPSQVLSRANAGLPSPAQLYGGNPLNPRSLDEQANIAQQLPFIGKAPFSQAASTGPGGIPNAESPALTKGGKLAVLLMSGLKGALAGRAKSEETVAATGGHRSGGAGMGFLSGYQQPYQEAQQRQEAQLGQAGLQPIPLPGGVSVPAAMAPKFLSPYLGYQGKIGAAEIGAGAKEKAAQTEKEGRIGAAQINKRFLIVPGVGVYDTALADEKGKPALLPGTSQGITVTPELADEYKLPKEFIGKPMKLTDLAAVQRSSVFENVPLQTGTGPVIANRRTGEAKPVTINGKAASPSAMAGITTVADPNAPGQTLVTTKGAAVGQAGPQSASVTVPKKAAEAEVPTKIGDQKVAFNTMLQHAQLLRQAAKAMQNGDVRMLNNLSNKAKSQFGDPDLTNFDAIANAYNHEVTAVISKGHITDSEVAKGGGTMPSGANFATIDKVLSSYENLAKSKMQQLNQQKQSAVSQAQPGKSKEIHYKVVNGQLVAQ